MELINLFLIVLLIAMTAFFVATEFAVVKMRSTRIDQLVAEGNRNAKAAKHVISHLDEYLSACQLGITITSLGLGWLGEPTVEKLLHPVFIRLDINESITHIVSFILAFVSITFLHVVVGELAPKTLAIQKTEKITLLFSRPIMWFYRIMFPFIKLLNGSARLVTGIFGIKPASEHDLAHSEEELRIILSQAYEKGEINQNEYKYVDRIFEFDNRLAREIMVPRTEIVGLSKDSNWDEVLDTLLIEQYTRYPVLDGDKDNIIGFINMKELTTEYIKNKEAVKASSIVRYIHPVIMAIETTPVQQLLAKMQKEQMYMAILFDEYGGTAGLITMEDILEEIVGEIRDEFDHDEIPSVRKIAKNHYIVDSKYLLSELNSLLKTDIYSEDVDTLGGWILSQKYEIELGDTIEDQGYTFTIQEMDGNYVKYVRIKRDK
ncbi:hemolysin family protein [Peribacillus acanthi]|uniref:hemolysin family protein n=1 Tax=Peribacillus acanthi TaxID=2171554 RepID=UPI000D3E7B7C|nr:hemolysin family protein [Peribacillus acanthi]